MLDAPDAGPDERRERRMRRIGRLVTAFCRVGGWYAPMYRAGRFERNNVGEYERAAQHAVDAGYPQFAGDLLDMARVEAPARALLPHQEQRPLAVEVLAPVVAACGGALASVRRRAATAAPCGGPAPAT
jgi:hypothetical protein